MVRLVMFLSELFMLLEVIELVDVLFFGKLLLLLLWLNYCIFRFRVLLFWILMMMVLIKICVWWIFNWLIICLRLCSKLGVVLIIRELVCVFVLIIMFFIMVMVGVVWFLLFCWLVLILLRMFNRFFVLVNFR